MRAGCGQSALSCATGALRVRITRRRCHNDHATSAAPSTMATLAMGNCSRQPGTLTGAGGIVWVSCVALRSRSFTKSGTRIVLVSAVGVCVVGAGAAVTGVTLVDGGWMSAACGTGGPCSVSSMTGSLQRCTSFLLVRAAMD